MSEIGVSVALGNFDGVHIGHQKVIAAACELSKKINGVAAVLLFEPHPQKVISGSRPACLIPDSLRMKALKKAGAETAFTIDFNEIREYTPEEFFYNILIKRLNVKAVSCGYNYSFGKNGKGDVKLLKSLCEKEDIILNVVGEIDYKNEPVSCTRIRRSVKAGEAEDAFNMLGRPFMYDFTVVGGDRRGRLLGSPTINQFFPEEFAVPKNGVYAATAFVDNKWHAAVANIGLRPTIGTDSLRSETCILNFSGDLYGKNIPVGLLKFLREEKRFRNLDELSKQISEDAKKADEIFKELTGDLDWL